MLEKKNVVGRNGGKPWPVQCLWPEPSERSFDYEEDFIPDRLDDAAEELMDIKDYFDELVESGRLNEDYSLNEDYKEDDGDDEVFVPEKGEDYWDDDDGFLYDVWLDELSEHVNLLKIVPADIQNDPVVIIREITGYEFINENLLRQAFTRRAFAVEYGLPGCSEELELLGDSVINSVVTREIARQFSNIDCSAFAAPFQSKYDEGELTKLRQHFTCKEYLSARAKELELGKFVLYGTGESETESALEDMMEAVIGAVAVDCEWDERELESAVNELLYIQLDAPDKLLKKSFYDILNAWHQKHFGCMPIYEVHHGSGKGYPYESNVRFEVPDNDKGIHTSQRLVGEGGTRSRARERAAERAYDFIVRNGLWVNLKDAGLVPKMDNSINQLQELYQKKYLENKPEYEYEEGKNDWYVTCLADTYHGFGRAGSKVQAKKNAAYMVLIKMLRAAGICEKEWEDEMYRSMKDGEQDSFSYDI